MAHNRGQIESKCRRPQMHLCPLRQDLVQLLLGPLLKLHQPLPGPSALRTRSSCEHALCLQFTGGCLFGGQ